MGVSQKAFNEKQRKRLNSGISMRRDNMPENITTSVVACQNCGFKARYEFVRCPECDEIRKV